MFQTGFTIADHRYRYRNVFADGGRVNVNVHDFRLRRESIGFAGNAVIEPYPDGYHQIAGAGAHVCTVSAVHSNHAEP